MANKLSQTKPFVPEKKPRTRSRLRARLGFAWYGTCRRLRWIRERKTFATTRSDELLPALVFAHHTPLYRRLKDVDMELQRNKVVNLRLAVACLDGLIIRPGQSFSYWYLIGKPTARRGFLPGMVLSEGHFFAGTGGGLCQLSNLIFWMVLHSPLTVVERHRHGYDVFPDSNRTQPFGSGATCFYPHGDLVIKNETDQCFQLVLEVGKTELLGALHSEHPLDCRYKVVERDAAMVQEFWGGYTRRNTIWQECYRNGELIGEKQVVANVALMMYDPLLPATT